jgi:hypothetical protein
MCGELEVGVMRTGHVSTLGIWGASVRLKCSRLKRHNSSFVRYVEINISFLVIFHQLSSPAFIHALTFSDPTRLLIRAARSQRSRDLRIRTHSLSKILIVFCLEMATTIFGAEERQENDVCEDATHKNADDLSIRITLNGAFRWQWEPLSDCAFDRG